MNILKIKRMRDDYVLKDAVFFCCGWRRNPLFQYGLA